MRGLPLHVEKSTLDVLVVEQVHQPDEGDLRGVPDPVEHRLTGEQPPIATPYSPPTSSPSTQVSTECAQPSSCRTV